MAGPLPLRAGRARPGGSCRACPSRCESIFRDVPEDILREFERRRVVNLYRRGQVLFYEGNHSLGIFCVHSGGIKLYKTGSLGRQCIVGIAGAGTLLGHRNVLSDEPFPRTAEALEDSSVCFLDRTAFHMLLEKSPGLARRTIQVLCAEASRAEEALMSQVDLPAHVRLARFLLGLQGTHGRATARGTEVRLPLSRGELAEAVGVTRETAVRLLSSFKARGAVDGDGRRLLIRDAALLGRIARV